MLQRFRVRPESPLKRMTGHSYARVLALPPLLGIWQNSMRGKGTILRRVHPEPASPGGLQFPEALAEPGVRFDTHRAPTIFTYSWDPGYTPHSRARHGRQTEPDGELGFSLFYREHRCLVPSQRAHCLYQEVLRAALDGIDNIKQTSKEPRLEADAMLRIIAPPYFSYTVMPEALARNRQTFPNVQFSLALVT